MSDSRKLVFPHVANIHAPEIPAGPEYPEQDLRFSKTPAECYKDTRYLMIVNGKRQWMTFWDCARTLDANYPVEDGGLALDITGETMVERELSQEEKNALTNAADDWSGMR